MISQLNRGSLGSAESANPVKLEFELSNETFSFAPRYYPRKVEVTKERRLSEQQAICEGEDVNDVGPKNRVVSVRGYLLQRELGRFHRLGDIGDPVDVISLPWSGEVTLKKTDLEGPIALDIGTGDWLYAYTIELKSTGEDEYGEQKHGIISEGN